MLLYYCVYNISERNPIIPYDSKSSELDLDWIRGVIFLEDLMKIQ